MIRTRPIPSLLVALSAVVLTACGSNKQDPGKLLAQTFGSQAPAIHSGRLDLRVDVDGPALGALPSPLGVRLAGPFAGTRSGGVPKFDLTLDLRTSGGTVRLGAISTGDRGWLVFQDAAYTLTDGLFRRLDRSRRQALSPGTRAGGGDSPLRALGIDPRRWLRDPRTAGDETLAGEDVTHVRARVDVPRLLADVPRLLAKAPATGRAAAPATLTPQARRRIERAVRDARVDVYSGRDDHVLRRIALDVRYVAGGRAGRLRLGLGISHVNDPQPIGPPARARPIAELAASLQDLATTLRRRQAAGVAGPAGDPYERCLADAAGDLARAQACAGLVGR
ncbi:MAG TPA: hypothetical protein VLA98_06935 [Solirubrobacteraceae bacterium]|nr:hypothetical protein [Solirubrobacteraceae bacterium]